MPAKRLPLLISLSSGLLFYLAAGGNAQPTPKLSLDQPAPDISAITLDGKAASLATLRSDHKDKLLVLQFASITDPIFRSHAAAVEKLAIKESDKATFIILYQREAHPADGTAALELNEADGFNIPEPQNLDERLKLARQMADRVKIKNQTVLVDTWNNLSASHYGSYPNMTFIVDAKGSLRAGYPFMDVTKVQAAIDLLVENKPLPVELKGLPQRTGPAPFDFSGAAMEMTGGRGPASIASVLEHVDLTDQQRLTLFPALADFLSDVQTFRQTRQAAPNLPAQGLARGPNAAPPSRAAAGNPNAPQETKTVEDLQQAQTALRTSAGRLKSIVTQTLPKKDATSLFEALDNMVPAQRLFQ